MNTNFINLLNITNSSVPTLRPVRRYGALCHSYHLIILLSYYLINLRRYGVSCHSAGNIAPLQFYLQIRQRLEEGPLSHYMALHTMEFAISNFIRIESISVSDKNARIVGKM